MGLFDTYENCQLKVGDVGLKNYKIGDKVEIPDGIYIALEGIIIIKNGVLIGANEPIFDKWGMGVDQDRVIDIITARNPVDRAIRELKEERRK